MARPLSQPLRNDLGAVIPSFARLAPPPPEGLVASEIEERTRPGDVVLDLHARGAAVARSAIDRYRRAYSCESLALTRLVAEVVLRPPDLRHFDAALTALADHPRGQTRLRPSIEERFTSRCAVCGRWVVVDEFLWEAGGDAPARKSYNCFQCRERGGNGDHRNVPADELDAERARADDVAVPVRASLRSRFPVPTQDDPLPDRLLDLYTPRTLDAIEALVTRFEQDLRAPAIDAAMRLGLAHLLLPGGRLNVHPGRIASLRVGNGRIRTNTGRGWRERNPWSLFEEGCRHVRSFIQRLESSSHAGSVYARFGADLGGLLEGTANVVVEQPTRIGGGRTLSGTLHPALASGGTTDVSAIRLVLGQPPLRWTAESLGYAYLATAVVLGREAAATLPLEAIFGPAPRTVWGWEALILRRSLGEVRGVLAPDARVVLILDGGEPEGLAARVIGAAWAGYSVSGATLGEATEGITGTVELVPRADPGGLESAADEDDDRPFRLAELSEAVTETAVALIRSRGEPAPLQRVLGEVFVRLDRLGHLRRLVGAPIPGAGPDAAAGRSQHAHPADAAVDPSPGTKGSGPGTSEAATGTWGALSDTRHVEAEDAPPASGNGHATETDAMHAPGARPSRRLAPGRRRAAPPSAGFRLWRPERTSSAFEEEDEEDGAGEPEEGSFGADAEWLAAAAASGEQVDLLLAIVMGELRRPDNPRLVEIEPGRWWLRRESDVRAAELPLADRLEWAVFAVLSASGVLTEESFRERIAAMYRGHDLPDEELVRACLESYRDAEASMPGRLVPRDDLQSRYAEHGELVGLIAEYGSRLGLRRWIAPRERRRRYSDGLLGDLLSDIETKADLTQVVAGDPEALEATDCIWYGMGGRSRPVFLFEVEWTAMLAEPLLRRGPRIPTAENVVRFLVVLPERAELVRLKLARSPLLRGALEEGNWHILKADHLRRLVAREGADLDALAPLLGLDPEIEHEEEQLPLFS